MDDVTEVLRLPAPAPQPQALAFDGTRLWLGSLSERRLYAIDPATWTAHDAGQTPGEPWGMTAVGDELRVICDEGPEVDRVIRRFVPGQGFVDGPGLPVPDGTGSQLGYDGTRLYVSQWYNQRILALDHGGAVTAVIEVPHQIAGQVIVDGCFYLVTTDDEDEGDFLLTRVDPRGAAPAIEDLARIPFGARGLAFDGTNFWTNHRAADELVAFVRPDLLR